MKSSNFRKSSPKSHPKIPSRKRCAMIQNYPTKGLSFTDKKLDQNRFLIYVMILHLSTREQGKKDVLFIHVLIFQHEMISFSF